MWGNLAAATSRQDVQAKTGPQHRGRRGETGLGGECQALGGLVNMKLERKRRQEGFLAPWLAEPGGGGDLVLETWPGEAVRLADRCVGHGVGGVPGPETQWWGESDGQQQQHQQPRGHGPWEQRQHAGVGFYMSRTQRTSLPTSGPSTQEKELRPSPWSLDSELHLFCYVSWKFKSAF